jgi:protein phosphatase
MTVLKGSACVTTGVVRVSVFGKSDLGRAREHNEDAFLVADLSSEAVRLSAEDYADVRRHAVGAHGSLFMVADGMGGAAAGEVASAMATHLIFQHMATAWPADSDRSATRFAYRLHEAVELANERIYRHALAHPEMRGMGTTVTAAGVFDRDLYLTQVGDSRAYLIRDGRAIQLTKDQSLMQRLIDAGEITEEEAERSDRRHIILQALGPDPRIKVDLTRQSLRRGDLLLLCSDGLSSAVKNDELAQLAAVHAELPAFCTALIDLANERGGLDNITVVAAHFAGDGLAEPEAAAEAGYEAFSLPEPPDLSERSDALLLSAGWHAVAPPLGPGDGPVSRDWRLVAALVVLAALVLLFLLSR